MTPDRILRDQEVLELTGIGKTTRRMLEKEGQFPPRRVITGRLTGYSEREVLAWVEERLHGEMAEYVATHN